MEILIVTKYRGRAANDEKIDRHLISKALPFYENTCITVRRESAGNIVIRIQRSRTHFFRTCVTK